MRIPKMIIRYIVQSDFYNMRRVGSVFEKPITKNVTQQVRLAAPSDAADDFDEAVLFVGDEPI